MSGFADLSTEDKNFLISSLQAENPSLTRGQAMSQVESLSSEDMARMLNARDDADRQDFSHAYKVSQASGQGRGGVD